MKHLLTTTILLVLALLLPATAFAYDFEVDGIYYNTNGNEATVTHRGTIVPNSYSGDVTIPATVTYNGTTYSVTTIGYNAFYKCTGLTRIDIPSSVTTIGYDAFQGCTGLTRIDIPNSVNTIDNYAFSGCTGLTSVNIPNSVTNIGSDAFASCIGLTSVYIPNSVTEISGNAFSGCTGLTSITVATGNTTYDSRDNCNAIIKTANNILITGCMNTIIPNSVTTIGYKAFYNYTGLTSVNIPNSVTTISVFAFAECTGLTRVNIPNSVTTIDNAAFAECSGLASINIPSSVTTIGDGAFYGCTGLTSINIPNSVTTIDYSSFGGCTALTSIIVASDNVRYDSRDNCNAIIETVNNKLIMGCKTTVIPNSVTTIGYNAFERCTGLTKINIPNSVITIGDGAFLECTGLTSISIPNSVTTIDGAAFAECTGLTSINIPNSVTTIGDAAFIDCTGLNEVFSYISDLSQISMGHDVFNVSPNNYSNRTLHVPSGTLADYQADDKWSQYFGTIVEMPNCFEVDGIYYKIINTKEVEVTKSPNHGYTGDITIPCTVTYDDRTYSVTSISDYAFGDCTGLRNITLPNSVTSIGKHAFMNDAAIESVTCEATTPPACDGLDIFTTNVYNHAPLVVPAGCARAYMSDQCWGQFVKIVSKGDANMDGNTSISDVTAIISLLMSNGDASPAADVNGDGEVNIKDITTLISQLMNNQ